MDLLERLRDKNHGAAYALLLELEAKSAETNELYSCFESFMELLTHKSSYVRIRGFRLCCAQAKWDTEDKLEKHLPDLLAVLDDAKPTAVRQALTALHEVVHHKPELRDGIHEKLADMDLTKYQDSMRLLIEKDIADLRKALQ